VPSIINGLFSGRSGIQSHGNAIAVIGDNISNSSTVGFKSSRAEFEDLIAGGQAAGKVIGSGSAISAISTIFEQGTLEFTSRPLDLAIDGNGFFAVNNTDGSRLYSRAGNFKVDSAGYITTQGDLRVLGFPANGSGALEELNTNNISQDSVATANILIAGNVDRTDTTVPVIPTVSVAGTPAATAPFSTTTYDELSSAAEYSVPVEIFDSLGASHTATFYLFRVDATTYAVRGYVNSEDVDTTGSVVGVPRLITESTYDAAQGTFNMVFQGDGTQNPATTDNTQNYSIRWNNGSVATAVTLDMSEFTSYSSKSNIQSITQDGKGVGAVTTLSIEKNGDIFALLSNGQSAVIGTIGLVNFSNPEGLKRIGNQLLQQSSSSGEPIVGRPLTGTLGSVSSGSVELSTVDIADQFVKLITLQRGFQANSRIITTINQLLNELIQLA
jgi:flagellar hook protein FlgE